MSVPPQLAALVEALPQLDKAATRTTFEVAVMRMKKQEVPEATAEAIKGIMDAAGVADQNAVFEASQFLLRQAAKIPEAKRASRLTPIGFTVEHLDTLEEVLSAATAPKAEKAAPKPPPAQPAAEEPAEAKEAEPEPESEPESEPEPEEAELIKVETRSTEELDRMAAEMAAAEAAGGAEVSSEEEPPEEDEEDEPEGEPDFEDRDPCELLLKLNRKILEIFLKASLNHILGQDLSTSDIDSIEEIARDSGVSQRTLRQLLRLMKNLLTQGLEAKSPREIPAAQVLRAAKPGATAVEEGVPPEGSPQDVGEVMLQALNFMPTNKARMFAETVLKIRQLTAPEEKEEEDEEETEDSVHFRGWLLAEVGDDEAIGKRAWQRRWLVISPGKVEIYYTSDSTSEADRICMMPLKFVYIQEPKTARPDAPHAFRLGVKDMKRIEGEAINKLILDAETEDMKKKWMDTLVAAKLQDAPMEGPMRFEIPHKMKKWTKFEDRWFVAAPGRLEMFPSKEAVETDDYISIIPLSNWQSPDGESSEKVLMACCEFLPNTKTKRQDAPNCFRVNVGTPINPVEVIGRPIKKMVLDPETLDMKEEWLQALDLCQQSEMPEEIQGRIKESAEADDGDDEPEEGEEEVVEVAEEPVVKPKAVRPPTSGKAFDDYGRRRGDPAFGKPLGWEPDNGSEDSEGESDDEESASDDDEDSKPRGPPRKMLEAWFDDELIKPNTLTKKFGNARDTKHFYVLHVGWLAVYSAPVDTTDPSSREQRVSLIPLKVCTVSEELVVKEAGKIVSKKKEKPLSFHIDVNNPKSVRGEQYNKVIIHPANEATREEWLDKLALACDSDESDESDEEEEKAPADDVVASAKEYDAVQLLSSEETEEREVVVRSTVCGVAVLDGDDKSMLLQYFPNASISEASEQSVKGGKSKACAIVVKPSRVMPKKVKRVELNFIMKDPQRLVDAVQANMAGAPESDACTDPVVLSFFDTHRNFNSCGYTQLKAERLLDKALTREVIKKDKLGRKEPKKETTWWTRQVLTLNEAALSWFDVDESGEPSAKPAGSVRLADIENVKWPAHGEHHGRRARIQCFAVEADAGRHVFAAPSKAWARHFVESVRDLSGAVSET